jgi:probable HAF family extracellular repeat protein
VSGAAQGMNDLGHVVGYASPPGYAGIGTAFLWDATNGARLLGTLGGTWSEANGVNASDDVVGTSETADGQSHGFLWSQGTMIDLTVAGDTYSEGYAISDAGVVTGIHSRPSGETRAFRWTRSEGMVDVGPMYTVATDGPTSMSTDINTVGQITGGIEPPGQVLRAAVRQPSSGEWQELMPDWPFQSFALGVNNLGVIVGMVTDSNDLDLPSRAAIWTPMRGTVVGAAH